MPSDLSVHERVSRRLWNQPSRNDSTTIMGMQTRAVYILAAAILIVCTVLGFVAGGITQPWLFLLSMLILTAAALILLSAPGDPMVLWATIATAVLPSSAVVVAAPGLSDLSGMAWASISGPLAMILSFMAVRGRVRGALGGYLCYVAAALAVNHWAGPAPHLVGPLLPNLAVMLMAVVFAAIVRPRARQIYALRSIASREAALEASERASLAVRDNQMTYLDHRARPLLARIAQGGPFDPETISECGLVEAALRDRIRAAGLATAAIAAAAREARSRGVRVLMLDDRQVDEVPVPPDVQAGAIEALRGAPPVSTVTVRLLPSGRENLATITIAQNGVTELTTYGLDGTAHRACRHP